MGICAAVTTSVVSGRLARKIKHGAWNKVRVKPELLKALKRKFYR